MSRRVRYDQSARVSDLSWAVDKTWRLGSYRSLRDGFLDAAFPGISCLDFGELSRVATFISSLRDRGRFPYVDALAQLPAGPGVLTHAHYDKAQAVERCLACEAVVSSDDYIARATALSTLCIALIELRIGLLPNRVSTTSTNLGPGSISKRQSAAGRGALGDDVSLFTTFLCPLPGMSRRDR
jgi:hypothetical protein